MTRHIDQQCLDLYDRYVHGLISRREFLDQLARVTASTAAATAVFNALLPNYALAAQVAPDDPDIEVGYQEYASPQGAGTMRAYQAALDAAGKDYTMHMYPAANHGFHNDTTPRYDADAAALSWQRTIEFFSRNLV